MCRITVFVLPFLFLEQTVFSATVDQRQTGDLNVQIDLKNLQIVGLMKGKEDYVDYDYAYDYSEMTIKPPNGTRTTTKKPLNITETATSDKDNTTVVTTLFAELDQTTSLAEKYTGGVTVASTSTSKTELNESISDLNATTPKLPQDLAESTSSNSTAPSCKKGFFRNSQGNCELKLQNPSNQLLKMLRDKIKLNLANGGRQP